MALFENYFGNKPGKGISREQIEAEREKLSIGGFFKIYKRKFWQMVQLNMLTFLFYIPLLLFFVFLIAPFLINSPQVEMNGIAQASYNSLWKLLDVSVKGALSGNLVVQDFIMKLLIGTFFVAVPVVAIGPVQSGTAYLLQSFIRERPVFLTHDFFKNAKKNFGQSLLVSFINILLTALFGYAIYFYKTMAVPGSSFIWVVGLAFILIIFVVFILMNLFIYPMIVTFNVTLKQLYKNAFFLAMTSFFKGLLVLVIDAALIYAVYTVFLNNIQMLALALAGFVFTTIGLINNYFSFKYIKYYLLDPALAAAEMKKNEENGSGSEEE